MVLNPFYALVFACHDHCKMHNAQRLDAVWPHGDVHSALGYLFPQGPAHERISDYLTKTVQLGCPAPEAPKHIFIFVLESQDSWPLLPDYLPLGMNPCLHELAGKGVHFPAFVSAGEGTMESLGAILSGLPWSSVRVNFQPTARQPYPTALAPVFKRLGYEVQFFYGGYLSWQRIEQFCKDQGFDAVWGGHVMGDFENNEWGVDDKQLLAFLARTVDPKVPSVNVILTTSNHPRYTVDVEREGCPVGKQPLPPELEKLYDGHVPWRVLGHTWYTDRELGRCIQQLASRCPKSLFVITGDHHSRRFIHQAPGLYERKSVPLILYSPMPLLALQQARPLETAGSHIDIVPTVLECVAPWGFAYTSFGQALCTAPSSAAPSQAYGAGVVLGPRYMADATQGQAVLLPWADQGLPSAEQLAPQRKRAQAFLALSWWMSLHGDALPPAAAP
jgi:phosphoglycerol transferase MdoB-like AlkP superfamily enzyme